MKHAAKDLLAAGIIALVREEMGTMAAVMLLKALDGPIRASEVTAFFGGQRTLSQARACGKMLQSLGCFTSFVEKSTKECSGCFYVLTDTGKQKAEDLVNRFLFILDPPDITSASPNVRVTGLPGSL